MNLDQGARFLIRLLLAWLIAGGVAAQARECGSGLVWPGERWREEPVDAARPEVAALTDYAFPDGLDEAARAGVRTNGLVVARGDAIVYERYARGFGPETPHIAWSVSKSVLHAVYGAAVRDGLVDIDRPVAERSPWIGTGGKARITYRDLLAMSSGLGFAETYEYAPLRSSVVAMLYTRGRRDMGRFAADHPLVAAPGSAWSYKSGDSLILARALRDLVGPERYPDYPWTALFDRIGVRSAVWERDGDGVFVGSSYLYATPRDLARIGLLYLADGCWAGERVLPEGWVAYAGTQAPALQGAAATPPGRLEAGRGPLAYGAHWWLNLEEGGRRPFTAAPEDTLIASGHWGQKLILIPSRGLVIVRTADQRDGSFGTNDFLRLVLAAFAEAG